MDRTEYRTKKRRITAKKKFNLSDIQVQRARELEKVKGS
jgi:hypothetical protein